MSKPQKAGLMATLRAGIRRKSDSRVRSEAEDDNEIDDDEDTTDAEGEDQTPEDDDEDTSPDAEEDTDDETVDAEGEEDDDEDGEDTGPAASATRRERARCIAIFTHANADANPKLAAKLLHDGTSRARATSLLNAVGGGSTKSTGSLAARVAASQGNNKPGQDGRGAKSSSKIVSLNDRMAAANQNAMNKG